MTQLKERGIGWSDQAERLGLHVSTINRLRGVAS